MKKELALKELWMSFFTVTDYGVWGGVRVKDLVKVLAENLTSEEFSELVKEVWRLKAEKEKAEVVG